MPQACQAQRTPSVEHVMCYCSGAMRHTVAQLIICSLGACACEQICSWCSWFGCELFLQVLRLWSSCRSFSLSTPASTALPISVDPPGFTDGSGDPVPREHGSRPLHPRPPPEKRRGSLKTQFDSQAVSRKPPGGV